jgi:large subunit ribosomal protein L23
MRTLYEVIKRPIISEKALALAEVGNRYVFEVAMQANKHQVREAVAKLFKVDVKDVRTLVVHGKVKRFAKGSVRRANWKKAIVTLAEGQKLDLLQNG